ncbi:MAG: hypothetical protein SPE59_02500 [Treponema sp.]|nr:hypothetical protein [Treponema sp.]
MKFSKVLRRTSLLVMTCASLAFISCGPKPGEEEVPEQNDTSKTAYTLSVSEDTVNLVVGEDSKTVTVTTNGTFTVDVEAESVAEATVDADKITISPVKKGSTTVVVTCNEDNSKTSEITVVVTENVMTLTLTFDGFTVPGGTVSVLYGNGGDTDPSAYEYYKIAEGTISSDGSKAVVELNKNKANESGWFNGIKITVKDSSDTEKSVSYTPYFEFNADGYEMTVSSFKEETMTLKVIFTDDITVDSVEITYGTESSFITETAVVSEDGKTAEIKISNKYANDSGYLAVKELSAKMNDEDVLVEFKGTNNWFEFSKDSTKEVTYGAKSVYTELYSASYKGTKKFEKITGVNIPNNATELKVCFANIAGSGDWWIQINSDGTSWNVCNGTYDDSIKGYTIITSDADLIAKVIENGLYFVTGDGLTGTLTVSYK